MTDTAWSWPTETDPVSFSTVEAEPDHVEDADGTCTDECVDAHPAHADTRDDERDHAETLPGQEGYEVLPPWKDAAEPPSGPLPVPAPPSDSAARENLEGIANGIVERVGEWYREETAARAERLAGTPPVVADVADVVRRLMSTAEDLAGVARVFADAAATVREFVTDEAIAVGSARLVVPDHDTEIVVAPATTARKWVTVEPIRDVVAAKVAAAFAADLEATDVPNVDALTAAYLDGAKAGWEEVLRLATPSWKTTALGGLRQDLMAHHNDTAAAAVERAYGTRHETSETLTVTREALRRGRRA